MTRTILPLFLLLAACGGNQQPANEAEPANNLSEAAPQPAVEVPSLAGQWRVTQINGSAPVQVWPMVAQVTGDRFTLNSECRSFVWGLKQDRNVVQFTPQAGKDCGRVRSPAEQMIEQPISQANIAMFSNEGKEVQLSGSGGIVTLTRN